MDSQVHSGEQHGIVRTLFHISSLTAPYPHTFPTSAATRSTPSSLARGDWNEPDGTNAHVYYHPPVYLPSTVTFRSTFPWQYITRPILSSLISVLLTDWAGRLGDATNIVCVPASWTRCYSFFYPISSTFSRS